MTSAGPIISALPEAREIEAQYANWELDSLRPRVAQYDGSQRVLGTVKELPSNPSWTDPEVIRFAFEVPGVVPELAWEAFVKGVACVALIVDERQRPAVEEAVKSLAEYVMAGGSYPALDVAFAAGIMEAQGAVFENGEPITWRRLLAFIQGAFWLLSFVKSPGKKRRGTSPLNWVTGLCVARARAGFLPQ